MRAPVAGLFGEPDAIVRQDGMNPTGDDVQKIFGKFPGRSSAGFVHRLRYRKLAGAVCADEKVKLSFDSLNFGNIEVKEPDRIAPEVLSFRLVSFDIRPA